MTRGPVAVLLLVLGAAIAGSAHEVSGGLGAAAAATDLYQINCSDDGNGEPASLQVQIEDESPVAAPRVSVQVQKGLLLSSATDPVDGDFVFGPAISVNGGPGAYDVLVDKTEAGSESYTLSYHCLTGTGVHTGSGHSVRQSQ